MKMATHVISFRSCLAALVASIVLASPVAAQSRAERQINADLRMLQEHTQQLQLAINMLGEAVQAISQKLDEQANIDRKAFADLKLLSDNISGDVRVVREKVDETNVRLGTIGQEIQAIQSSIQSIKLAPPPPTFTGDPGAVDPAVGAATPDQAPPATTTTTPPPVPPGVSPTQTFDRARGDYMAGQYSLAVQGFESYIRTFPTLPTAADAQYYVGEAYRQDGKPKEALAAYDKVIANYPASTALPGARFKRGDVLETLGQLEAAKAEYEIVLKNHPESSEARLAKQRLDRLLRPIK
ncbi:MAG TPA: tol-pal system protein YbgF [Vicinamibacterales bacterium]|jgi:tol-pal system protein YbgF